MATNREHFDQTDANAEAVEEMKEDLEELVEDGLTGIFEGTVKKIEVKNGIITEIEMEE